MTIRRGALRPGILSGTILSLAFFVSACQRSPVTGPSALSSASTTVTDLNVNLGSDVNKQLAELRAVTAHYRDLDDAMAAGYNVQVTPCLELPGVGGMGFHYGNPAYINDPAENHLQPELLLFEPMKSGKMRFVGVEYIIPFSLVPPTAKPPIVLGQEMHADTINQIWALHAWVARENPTGIFEDWNPNVSCQFAN